MLRLLYCSRADIGDAGATDLAVHHILETSRRHNARERVTGALLLVAGAFAQFLEGPDEAVARVFERVRHDPRHHDIAVVLEAPATERLFMDWSMSFPNADAAMQALAPEAFRRCRDEPGEPAALNMLRLIRPAALEMLLLRRMGLAATEIW